MDRHDPANMSVHVDAVVIDLAANLIRLHVPGLPLEAQAERVATLDVGGNGRLIGLEIDDRYISVMDVPGADEPYIRSAEVTVALSTESAASCWVSVPRRGTGYEITYPSGNECWQVKSEGGQLIQVCATIDAAPSALRDAHERRRRPGSRLGNG
jgi:hypothetical protein